MASILDVINQDFLLATEVNLYFSKAFGADTNFFALANATMYICMGVQVYRMGDRFTTKSMLPPFNNSQQPTSWSSDRHPMRTPYFRVIFSSDCFLLKTCDLCMICNCKQEIKDIVL